MKRSAKSRRKEKDRRFLPSHRLNLEQLERRYYPGSVLHLLSWGVVVSSPGSLSRNQWGTAEAGQSLGAPGLQPSAAARESRIPPEVTDMSGVSLVPQTTSPADTSRAEGRAERVAERPEDRTLSAAKADLWG